MVARLRKRNCDEQWGAGKSGKEQLKNPKTPRRKPGDCEGPITKVVQVKELDGAGAEEDSLRGSPAVLQARMG